MQGVDGRWAYLREASLKQHAVVVGFLGAWCVVWVHMSRIRQHLIRNLHSAWVLKNM